MAEQADAVPDSSEGFQRRNFGDQRDDFDDEFGRIRTPAEIAKRKLRIPAVMHMVTACFGFAGTVVGAIAIIIDAFDDPYGFADESDMIGGVILAVLVLSAGGFLFSIVLAGGIAMTKLRRRRLALVSAFVVTSLSLAGPYGILFYPFGIWALILLYTDSIKREFGIKTPTEDSPATVRPPREPRPRFTVRLLLIMGKIGFPIMLFVLGMLLWDFVVYPKYWTTSEIALSIGFTLVLAGIFGAMLAYGLIAQKKFKPSMPVESRPKNDYFDD